jgi:hypothetical protein
MRDNSAPVRQSSNRDNVPVSQLSNGEAQDNDLTAPVSSRACAKKPDKTPQLREGNIYNEKIKNYNGYYQEIEREAETGVTKDDEREIKELYNQAFPDMTAMERALRDMEIKQEAQQHTDDPREQNEYMKQRYRQLLNEQNHE